MAVAMDGQGVALLKAREAAWRALCSEKKLSESIKEWQLRENPSREDVRLAEVIAYGTCQRQKSLEWIAIQLTPKGKLNLKNKEMMLLFSALYQRVFLDKIPPYAIASESVEIAKRNLSRPFSSFLNALLRNYERVQPKLSKDDCAVYFSYPDFFVQLLIKELGREKAIEVLDIQNRSLPIYYRDRVRGGVKKVEAIESLVNSPDAYIQNATPVALLEFLGEGRSFRSILDLCAAPGGKLLWLFDHFKEALLVANEPSIERQKRLRENIAKYGIAAKVTSFDGRLIPEDEKFDLIVIDAPCSNSGVLHRRPEARWRLEKRALSELEKLQKELVERAAEHLFPGGEIWYMTCSIIDGENGGLLRRCKSVRVEREMLVLPDVEGRDGGYSARVLPA